MSDFLPSSSLRSHSPLLLYPGGFSEKWRCLQMLSRSPGKAHPADRDLHRDGGELQGR